MNRTNSQFGFAMGLDLSADVLKVIAYHEGYGQRIRNIYAISPVSSPALSAQLNGMAGELLYNLSNDSLELNLLQRAVTQLLLVQIGDIKLHGTVKHAEDLVRNLRVALAHPMSSGDHKVVMFIQGQADIEKARLDHVIHERKMSFLRNIGGQGVEGAGEGGSGGAGAVAGGQEEAGGEKGFWKGVGRRIKKSFSGSSSCGK